MTGPNLKSWPLNRLAVCNLHQSDVVFFDVSTTRDSRVTVRATPIVSEWVLFYEKGLADVSPGGLKEGT